MRIDLDPTKRDRTLAERGLDFADSAWVFAGPSETAEDVRFACAEPRFVAKSRLDERMAVVV